MKNKILSLCPILLALAAFALLLASTSRAQIAPSFLDQPPKVLSQQAPSYSYELRHEEVQGTVVVSFTVLPSGEVANATIVSSSDWRFNQATLLAVSQWKYSPGMKAGAPVSTRVLETVKFTLPSSSS